MYTQTPVKTYCCNVDTGHEMRATLYLRPVQAVEDLANVCRQRREDLWGIAAHAHEANRGLWVRASFCGEDQVHGILLCFPSRGYVVAISARFAVVDPAEVSSCYAYELGGRTLSLKLLTPSCEQLLVSVWERGC
jgi:hypothetical protein